ncbi:MAG: ABC transporter permease [Deltaproteobacteria bacterium]|nr:ABC transporter permease [Deltaproteobacteria bacterium]MDZ4341312.1 ABC transporter permease [Candidatus Binatia bacterium]
MFKKEIVRGAISISAGVVIWEILARLLLENELLIPPPSSVLRSFWTLAVSGKLNKHFEATLTEFAYGFSTACILGIIIGYFMGMYRWFDEIMDPWIATLYSIPVIAIVPLIIIWFGIGLLSKIIVVFKITVVAIILNTAAGIKNLDPVWLELAQSLRLAGWQTTYKIRFPGALPYIITGMRLGVGRALLAVVVAELMASNAGLGYLLRDASETWDSPKLFVTVILLAVIGLVSFNLIKRLERRMAPWRQSAEWSSEA